MGINGSFNNWGDYYNRHPLLLKNLGGNKWGVTVNLLPDTARKYTYLGPGFYEYKFVTYRISGKDTSITAWIPDPQNPNMDPDDNNNSILYVTDPMIYRLLPLSGSITKEKSPLVTAKIAVGPQSSLDISSIIFSIDGTEIPNSSSFYDPDSNSFKYQVQDPLSLGEHTLILTAKNSEGFTAADTSTYKISNLILSAPYLFTFDPYSPSLKFLGDSITSVAIQGSFNNYGSDPLTGPDENGLFKIKEILPLNVKTGYQFIISGASSSTAYLNDPDNPRLGSDYNPYVIKTVATAPEIEGTAPAQGSILNYPTGTVNIGAIITPNDSNTVIDSKGVHVFLDDNEITAAVDSVKEGYQVSASANNLTQGMHTIKFTAKDSHGNSAKDVYQSFGVYAAGTGYHYVDNLYDDDGIGTYKYPSGSAAGSADMHSIDINLNPSADSLRFEIKMGAVSANTRIALEIVNSLDGSYVESLSGAEIKVPEWNNRGVYAIIAAPGSGQLSGNENVLYISRDPLQSGSSISINNDAQTSGSFKFSIALNDLEAIMGSFTGKWYFGAFSYFANSGGIIKAGGSLGGSDLAGNPDVYDAAFFESSFIQHRILSNYILPYFVGGPREAKIGTEFRGSAGITPAEISAQLANRVTVNLLTDGGDWYEDTVRVFGQVGDVSITSASFHVKNGSTVFDTSVSVSNGIFSALLPLEEGTNIISASIVKNSVASSSKGIVFAYHAPNGTQINLSYTIGQSNVTIDAGTSTNINGLPVSFSWTADPSNPSATNLSGTGSSSINFASPSVDGEYYYTLKASTSKDTIWARAVITVDSGKAYTVDLKTWHPSWVDKAVVYEIYPRSYSFFGNLKSITQGISRLKKLGINCIWLMPIMPAASPHGYNITDYFDINPDLGTKQDFTDLINAAHQNDIKVIMDLVINHTSAVHPFMEDAYKYRKYSPYYNFYQWDANGNYKYLFNWWDLPNINYEEKWVRDYLIGMVKYWVEDFNIDGYRCDVAWGVNDTRPSGPAFWQRFRNELKNIKPDIFLLAEASADGVKYFDDKFDSGYDWPLYNQLKSVMNHNAKISSIDSLLNWYESSSYPSYVRPFRFLENHDEDRFISDYSMGQTKMAAAMLLTQPGVPMIYAGQETGELTQRNMIGWNDPYGLEVYYKSLIQIRNTNPALQQGTYISVGNSAPDTAFSYLRISGDNKALMINNFYDKEIHPVINVPDNTLNLNPSKTWYANDVFNGTSEEIDPSALSNYKVDLGAYGSKIIIFSNSAYTDVEKKDALPTAFNLEQNYPNPFNPATNIRYAIPLASRVKIVVYNILGQAVGHLIDRIQTEGIHQISWNASAYASGVYFYTIEAIPLSGGETFSAVRKMILLK